MAFLGLKQQWNAFQEIIQLLYKHRYLTWEMTKRDITDRYSGQVLGAVWAIVHPLSLMGIYVFIFAFVFNANVGHIKEVPLDYTVYLLSGLIPWLTFQEALIKGTTSISSNATLVKQVVFPIEILPVKGSLATLFSFGVCILILMGYTIVSHKVILWTYLLLPCLFLFQAMPHSTRLLLQPAPCRSSVPEQPRHRTGHWQQEQRRATTRRSHRDNVC